MKWVAWSAWLAADRSYFTDKIDSKAVVGTGWITGITVMVVPFHGLIDV